MIVTLSGANDFSRLAELRKFTADFVAGYGDFGLEKIDAAEVTYDRILESVHSLPFLAPRRMVILSGVSLNKQLNDNIEKFLDAVADTTDLIITEAKFDKRLTLYKILKKKTEFKEFAALDERGLANWLSTEAKNRGGGLSAADALYLVERSGTNQLALHNELDKLMSYSQNVTKDSITLLTEPLPRSSMFDLLDVAFAGNHKQALAIYEDQRKQQVEPQAIFGMLVWQLHILAVVILNEKDSADTIASKAKLSPYVVRKSLGLTRTISQKSLKDLLGRALDLDMRLKSEAIDADDALRAFLLTL